MPPRFSEGTAEMPYSLTSWRLELGLEYSEDTMDTMNKTASHVSRLIHVNLPDRMQNDAVPSSHFECLRFVSARRTTGDAERIGMHLRDSRPPGRRYARRRQGIPKVCEAIPTSSRLSSERRRARTRFPLLCRKMTVQAGVQTFKFAATATSERQSGLAKWYALASPRAS